MLTLLVPMAKESNIAIARPIYLLSTMALS
jgi:hypothetical protein